MKYEVLDAPVYQDNNKPKLKNPATLILLWIGVILSFCYTLIINPQTIFALVLLCIATIVSVVECFENAFE